MLFSIQWKFLDATKVQCFKAFSAMTPEDDVKDAGEKIKVIGRWHSIGGTGGVCICETDDPGAFTSWMANWSGMCDITVTPVVEDAECRKAYKPKYAQ